MKNVVITGAARGLGLCLTRAFIDRGDRVFVLVRSRREKLLALASESAGKLTIIDCDVTDTVSVRKAAVALSCGLSHIDILINNAGVNPDLDRAVDYRETDFDAMEKAFNTNTYGPMRVVQALDEMLGEGSVSAAISSGAGSLTLNTNIDVMYSYRASKTALNMCFRLYANTVSRRGVRVLLVDPGWLMTDMGGEGAKDDPLEHARLVADLLSHTERIPADALFVNFEGKQIPW
jgi:NAD(P)-dependent dehydrogenase (short-subunit alcohol dehydrogenase family)